MKLTIEIGNDDLPKLNRLCTRIFESPHVQAFLESVSHLVNTDEFRGMFETSTKAKTKARDKAKSAKHKAARRRARPEPKTKQ